MRSTSRALLRARRGLAAFAPQVRRIPELLLLGFAGVIIIAVIAATAKKANWGDILRGQAVNLGSAAVIAAFAYVVFVLRFRRAELTTYLHRRRPKVGSTPISAESRALVRTIVDELLDARPPRACIVVGPGSAATRELFDYLASRLAGKRRVPVVISVTATGAAESLSSLTRECFTRELVGSFGDARNAERLFSALVRKKRVVVLIRGLETVGQGRSFAVRRDLIAALLSESLLEGIPFVASLPADLTPSISEVAAFRVHPLPRSQLVNYAMRQLERRNITADNDVRATLTRVFSLSPTPDTDLVDLAIDLVVRRIRNGDPAIRALSDIFSDSCALRRHLSWMSEWTLGSGLEGASRTKSPACMALGKIGSETHHRELSEVSLEDASFGLDGDERRRFAAGLVTLTEKNVVALSSVGDRQSVRFTNPGWFAFSGALALRLSRERWQDLLRAGAPPATLDALTAALVMFGQDARQERSFVKLLHNVGLDKETPISLEMALASIKAQQIDPTPLVLGSDELAVLDGAWAAATDEDKLRFVSDVDVGRHPPLMDFLWSEVARRTGRNSFRVRRSICTKLGNLGPTAWARLGQTWTKALQEARRGPLSSLSRNQPHWRRYGAGVASLGWTLPSVLASTGDAHEPLGLLNALVELVAPLPDSSAGRTTDSPDIGLEISLAEGFKVAAVGLALNGESCDDRWFTEALDRFNAAQSWISRQSLLLALVLVGTTREDRRSRIEELASLAEMSPDEHLFVRETAALVRRALRTDDGTARLSESDIWFEDVEALADGGVNLSAEAHRLLGLSTLLINMTERRFRDWNEGTDTDAAIVARERLFTGKDLPACFRKASHAATMFDLDCDCEFRLCGPRAAAPAVGGSQPRRFSRSFVQRAQGTAGSRSLAERLGGPSIPERAFQRTWLAIDEVLARD